MPHCYDITVGHFRSGTIASFGLCAIFIEQRMFFNHIIKPSQLIHFFEIGSINLSTYTINKLNRGDNVNTDTLAKICRALNCTFDEIMEVLPEEALSYKE